MRVHVAWWRALALVAFLVIVALLVRLWPDLEVSLRSAGPKLLLLATAWFVASLFLRAWRWRILLDPVATIPVSTTSSALAIGGLASLLGLGQAGTVVRGVHLSRVTPVSTGSALASAAGDRVLDIVIWIVLIPVAFVVYPETLARLWDLVSGATFQSGRLLTTLAIVVSFLVILAILAGWRGWRRTWRSVLALRPLLSAGSIMKASIPTITIAVVDVLVLYAAARLLGLGVPDARLWLVIGVARGFSVAGWLIPWSIFGLSIQHGLFVAALVAQGIPSDEAGLYVLALHAALALAMVLGGALALFLWERPRFRRRFSD